MPACPAANRYRFPPALFLAAVQPLATDRVEDSQAITEWNHSNRYALAVCELAEAFGR